MSNTLLLKKSSVAGRIPLAADLEYGELALNYTDGKLYYKTSSNTVANLGGDTYVQIDRKSYTATAAQTTFSVTYALPYVDVYVNGVHMSNEDYTATSGTSIVLTQACAAGDQVDLMGFSGTLISPSQKTNGEVLVYNSSTGVWDNVAQSTLTAGNATKWATPRNLSLTGDATATLSSVDGSAAVSAALTLATVNSNVGSFGSSTAVPVVTVNAKGLVTSVTTANISGALTFTGDVTGSGTTGTSTVLTISPLAVTNAMLAGSIANAKLSNSAITIGSTSIALGATSTTLAGLTSVTSTGFTGALTGNASTATALATGRTIAITGDIAYTSGSFDGTGNVTGAATLATVNSNVGSFGSTTVIPIITVNAKGLVTGVTTASISGSISVTGGDLTLSGNTGTAITNATLATVNSNVGTYGSVTAVPVVTVNAKGLVTGVTTSTITPAVGSITGLGTGVATFLATPSSANLAAALTDESGTNTVAFTTSPTFITPTLGNATATSITYDHSRIESNTATTTATTADQVLVSLAGASYRSAEFQIQATDATGSKYHTATIKALHNGTSAVHTEFSSLNIGGVCATFNVDYSGGNLRLLCTPSSVNSTVFKITSIIGKV